MSRKSVGVLLVIVLISSMLAGCLFSIPGISQGNYRIQGTVFDEEGVGVENAAILVDSEMIGLTGSDGNWSYTKAKKGSLVMVQKPGWVFNHEPAVVREENQKIYFMGIMMEIPESVED